MSLRYLCPLLLVVSFGAHAAMPANPRPSHVEGEVLVRYRSAPLALVAKQRHARQGLSLKRALADGRTALLALPSFMPMSAALEALNADPDVELAEPNFRRYRRAVTPNDSLFGDQWGLHSTGQENFLSTDPELASVPEGDLNMDEAWDADGDGVADRVGDASVIVAVIDDAVETTHPDLSPNIVAGFNAVDGNNNPNPANADEFHGTSVAGCVAARGNNGTGVAGIAWSTSLMPIKFGFDTATLIDALEFARANGARIINGSFGGPGFSQAEFDTLQSLASDDILFVAAAGNDDSNIDKSQLSYPANYQLDNVLSVAATNRQDNIASFSQYGPISVDVAAPGLQIVTTAINGEYTTNPGISGTSFAAPYTAGVAALIRAHVPNVDFREIKSRLIESGSAVAGANPRDRTAGGRVDADRALEMAPGPSLVIRSIAIRDGGNGVFDPGETVNLDIVIRNQWENATSVVATLSADGGVSVNSSAQSLGTMATGQDRTATFSVTIPASATGHRYLTFALALSADGGYSVQRGFSEEVGRLTDGVTVTQDFASRDVDLYDEFHAWHFDLTQTATLTFRTTAPDDIDILVRRASPPQYNITVGINPEEDEGFFCTSGSATHANCQDPDTLLGAGPDGNETVTITDAPPGTYHVVVVNFAQRPEGMTYTLGVTASGVQPPATGGGGGGGAIGVLLLPLGLAALLRPRRGRWL